MAIVCSGSAMVWPDAVSVRRRCVGPWTGWSCAGARYGVQAVRLPWTYVRCRGFSLGSYSVSFLFPLSLGGSLIRSGRVHSPGNCRGEGGNTDVEPYIWAVAPSCRRGSSRRLPPYTPIGLATAQPAAPPRNKTMTLAWGGGRGAGSTSSCGTHTRSAPTTRTGRTSSTSRSPITAPSPTRRYMWLAESYQYSPDFKQLTIKTRQGITWTRRHAVLGRGCGVHVRTACATSGPR